ncbi:MAG: choice-of-anchor Q domain-containing protein [Nocardioides sp.]
MNSTVSANTVSGSQSSVGGIYAAGLTALTNVTVSGNVAAGSGSSVGGILMDSDDPPIMRNTIVALDSAAAGPDVIGVLDRIAELDHADPRFVRTPSPGADHVWGTSDDEGGNLRLQPTSPGVDAGDNAAPGLLGITTDVSGNPRLVHIANVLDTGSGAAPLVDIGAYETMPPIAISGGEVAENQPAGTVVGMLSLTAFGAGEAVTYSLVEGEGSSGNASFAIAGGELRAAAPLNYEAQASYSVRIRAEAAGQIYEAIVSITVQDVPDAVPLALIGDDNANTINIAEDAGRYIITQDSVISYAWKGEVSFLSIEAHGGDDLVTIGAGVGPCLIVALAGNDAITGGDGNDTIYGGDGEDLISGGAGDDSIDGNFGNDTISSGDGLDSIMGGLGSDSIHGGLGNDHIWGGDQQDSIWGDEGDDYIEGKGKSDTIYGGAGNDTLLGMAGADELYGEAGDDSFDTRDNYILDGIPVPSPTSSMAATGLTRSSTMLPIAGSTWRTSCPDR